MDYVQLGETALHKAALKGHVDVVERLLPKMSAAAINLVNNVRAPSFSFSLISPCGSCTPSTFVLSHAHMTFVARDDDVQHGNTALLIAASRGHADVVERLLPEMTDNGVAMRNNVRASSSRGFYFSFL